MRKDTWTVIGVMVALVGFLATFMVTGLASIESRLTAMDTHFSERLTAIDGRLHDMNTRLSRIEGHLGLPADIEPIRFETIGLTPPTPTINLFKEDGWLTLEPVARPLSPPKQPIPHQDRLHCRMRIPAIA